MDKDSPFDYKSHSTCEIENLLDLSVRNIDQQLFRQARLTLDKILRFIKHDEYICKRKLTSAYQVYCYFLIQSESWCELISIKSRDLENEDYGIILYWIQNQELPLPYLRYFRILDNLIKTKPRLRREKSGLLCSRAHRTYFSSRQKRDQIWGKWFQSDTELPTNTVKTAV